MNSKFKEIKYKDDYNAFVESYNDYVGPIYVIGDLIKMHNTITLPATTKKNNLIIINNKYPNWYKELCSNDKCDTLIISNFDKISYEEQELFIDIICKRYISSIKLPEKTKIIVNSKEKCNIISEIQNEVEVYKLSRRKK